MTAGRMIFYTTVPDEENSGSGVRRLQMLAAFRAVGYQVAEITGRITDRLPRMRQVMAEIDGGQRYDFLYMENDTIPLHMTEPRLELVRRHPLADAGFLRHCRRAGIPIGIYNTDVWWRFENYRNSVPAKVRAVRLPFYHLEYRLFAWAADVFYVPHLAMLEWIPGRFRRTAQLPHGTVPSVDPSPAPADPSRIELFFVGGIGPFYRLHNLVAAIGRVEGIHLTLCCRPPEWQAWAESYAPVMSAKVRIVHAQGAELQPYFRAADVLSCFVAPDPYWRATYPTKLFEYLGHGKPILAAENTNAGQFVTEQGIGWAVADDVEAIAERLAMLRSRPTELAAKAARAVEIGPEHSWQARARQATADLTALDRRPPA